MESNLFEPHPADFNKDGLSHLLKDLTKFSEESEKLEGEQLAAQRALLFRKIAESGVMPTYTYMLPLVLNLNGYPYTLRDHFPVETMFRTKLPRQSIYKTGRQISKSTSIAARGLMIALAIPHFSILFVTPLYEQIRRFSTNYMRPFIEQSPIRDAMVGTTTENSVLQRSFKNYSKMYFSFAFTDADRVRGISSSMCSLDEIQDMDSSLIPVIQETMSASKWRVTTYTGTPKTLDNTIEGKWQMSSQAEWAIPCPNCKHLNIPAMGYDLEKMLGPWHPDINENTPATICGNSKCRKHISPRTGFWIHKKPELRWKFPGYHIPQCIMPMHYADSERWAELLAKREGYGNYTVPKFYNEVLGESYDLGARLVTETDLKEAAMLPWDNKPLDPRDQARKASDYILRVLGVDWGGGGEEEISFTTLAVVGLRGDGKLDIIYGRRLLTPHDHMQEAIDIMRTFNMFRCDFLAHDYNGAGSARETIAIQAGVPYAKVTPWVYVRSAFKNPVTYHKSESQHSRNFWTLDKSRALQAVCLCIKNKRIRSFKYDYVSEENRGLMRDFLSLVENKVEMPRGPDAYMIMRNPHFPDDFAHSVTYACATIWHTTNKWPNLAEDAKLRLSDEQMQQINPPTAWDDQGPMFKVP